MYNLRRHLLASLSITALALIVTLLPSSAMAAFDPGNIIDDSIFTNKTSMSAQDIQAFLNSKVPTCNTNHPKDSSNSASDTPPWTCLKDFNEGGRSAAQIIYDAGQTYGINPQVILVTLQKEQALVTDDWPGQSKYRAAMGMGCPDTAACDSQYYGFTNQVNQGTRLLRGVYDQRSDWNIYYRLGNNYVRYSPTSSCGGSTVNITSRATAALYQYTPYQPNAAALANLYGTGDGCSAYGNRNFYRYFTQWFGSTHGKPYAASYYAQSAWPTLSPGQSTTVFFKYQNAGTSTWYDDASLSTAPAGTLPVHLATASPMNRASAFGTTWGANQNRPALNFAAVYESNGTTLAGNQHSATIGQVVKFSFTFTAPSDMRTGSYQESFQPVLDGSSDGAFDNPGTYLGINVSAVYQSTSFSQSQAITLKPGVSTGAYFAYKNTGNAPWYDDITQYASPNGYPTRLITSSPFNRSSIFGSSWNANKNRPSSIFSAVYLADGATLAPNQNVVQPGQIGRYDLTLLAPEQQSPATYREDFQPVQDGSSDGAMNDPGTYVNVTVPSTSVGKSTNTSETQASMSPSGTRQYTASFKNVGNTTWTPSTTKLVGNGATEYQAFKSSSWTSPTVITQLNESSVAPGATGTFTFTLSAPNSGGTYYFEVAPSSDGIYSSPTPAKYRISVSPPVYSAQFTGQSGYPVLMPGDQTQGYFSYKNTGNINWYDDNSISSAPAGSYPVHLATSHNINRASAFGSSWGANKNRPNVLFSNVYESDGTTLASNQHVVQPGQIAKMAFTFTANSNQQAGSYREYFQPVADGTPDGAFGDAGTYLDVIVNPKIYAAKFAGQSNYPVVAAGSTTTGSFSYKNTGNQTWYDDSSIGGAPVGSYPVHLATVDPINRASLFGSSWGPNKNRPGFTYSAVYEANGTTLAGNQHVVQPGQIAKFQFTFTALAGTRPGVYHEAFQPVADGTPDGAINYIGTYFDVTVTP